MKADLAEKVRGNLITQAFVVVLCIGFAHHRANQTAAIAELETLYVSSRMLAVTLGDVRNNDTDLHEAVPPVLEKELEQFFPKDPKMKEMDALATFIYKAHPEYDPPAHRVPLPSGGWLRFRAESKSFKTLGPPAPDSSVPLYEMTVVVGEDSDLHRPDAFKIKVTNAEQSLHPTSLNQVWELMHLRAEVNGIDEPMAAGDIDNRIRVFARGWMNATGDIGDIYSSARYSYEKEEINIPMINVQVSGSLALAAIALISTAFAGYCSYQCRMATPAGAGEPHAGFMILRPQEGTVAPGWWHHVVAQAEILCVQPPYWIGLAAPVICSVMLGISHNDINGWWLGWFLLPFSIAYTWLLGRAIIGVEYNSRIAAPLPA